jgi:class 3 adenylate cyclase
MHPEPNESPVRTGSALIVEDDDLVRELLCSLVAQFGLESVPARNGLEAMEVLELHAFELVLLDLAMPEIDGFEVLQRIKNDLALRRVPVLVLSGSSNIQTTIRCIEMGADDFLYKPVNTTLLKARIRACLEHKRLYDLEQGFLQRLEIEQERSERLLLNVLPAAIAQRLKQGEKNIAEHYPDCTVLFSDLVGFTRLATKIPPAELVQMLNTIFSEFDHLADRHGLEKIKTIGDAYMLVGGLPNPRSDHAEAVAAMALDMMEAMKTMHQKTGQLMQMRIGIHTGPVVAGIIGQRKFAYDLWGETVNIASRMESLGRPGGIHVSAATYERLKDKFNFATAGVQEAKGIGKIVVYLLLGKR